MGECRKCGATLSPDIDWCPQCYTPIEDEEPEVERRDTEAAGESEGEDERDSQVVVPPEYSAWKAGPYSFGPGVKIALTLVIVGLGVGLSWVAARIGSFYGTMGLALVLLFIGIYAVFAVMGLWGLWRPTRVK